MTSSTGAAPHPAWYRRLPKPSTEQNAALRRTSLLSQHHLFLDHSLDHDSREIAPRRSTIHSPPKLTTTSEESIGVYQPKASSDAETASPSKRSRSSDMAEHASTDAFASNSNAREHLCLCPPDPKIPRPRNSFILFRQHQQASIMAQNPGIPNPEVSKIIGEQWRRLSATAKEEWNSLAEEEKARHQQQYPGYRYHPRRNGRASTQSSVSGPSTAEPQEPCTKCGGRPMNCYSNSSPIYTPLTSSTQQAMTVQVPAKRGYVVGGVPPQRMQGPPTLSPEHLAQQQKAFLEAYPYQRVDPRLIYAVPPQQTLPTPPSSESHDAKRRRFNSNGVYLPTREGYSDAGYAYAHAHSPLHSSGYPQHVHPSQMPVQHGQSMQIAKPALVSPPRPVYPQPPQLQPVRPPHPHQRDRSAVALPPIETMILQTPTKPSSTQSQTSGVEAMIMSIPVLNKIKVLSQISCPLPAPGLSSPKPEVRGAIIAIEGMDATSVNSMTNSLAEQLEKEGKFAVKIFGGPDPYSMRRDASSTHARSPTITTDMYLSMLSQWHQINKEMVEYISTRPGSEGTKGTRGSKSSPNSIDAGHGDPDHPMSGVDEPKTPEKTVRISNETTQRYAESAFSPTTIGQGSELSMLSPLPAQRRSQNNTGMFMNESQHDAVLDVRPPPLSFPRPLNSTRIPPPPPTPPPATPPPPPTSRIPAQVSLTSEAPRPSYISAAEHQAQQKHQAQAIRPSSTAIPIAIVPHFQLTTVDASSISMPISDGFSPPAHWQWFATLWRGSVGPDITIVIRGADEDLEGGLEAARTSVSTSGSNPVGGGGGGRERPSNAGLNASSSASSTASQSGVEIRLNDCRAVIVKSGLISLPRRSSSPSVAASGGPGSHGHAERKATSPVTAAQHARELENWEKAKRRVGFEVDEFLRR